MSDKIRPIRWHIRLPGTEGFILDIEDEGAGEFVSIEEAHSGDKIRVDPDEWVHLRSAIDVATASIARQETDQGKTNG